MPQDFEIPLHLCQVLEEEFESLHARLDYLDEGDKVSLLDEKRRVVALVKADWDFRQGHVRRRQFAAKLNSAYEQWDRARRGGGAAGTDEKTDPVTYIATSAKHQALRDRATPAASDDEYVKALNALLADEDLFRCKGERFERLTTLRDETCGLLELVGRGDGCTLSKEKGDETRFRRLLLEDAFPDEIRRAYDLRVARVVRRVHELEVGRSAVCLSGGGIRSGTFALGVLQSLARHDLLDRFDYLSTVSGGGYIGGWLSAWIHRHRDGLRGVTDDLKGTSRTSRLTPEPEPLRHLRDYSNFITPKTGLLSADAWTFVVIYIRNLLLNWVVLVPLLASLLVVPRVSVAVILAPTNWWTLGGLLVFGAAGGALLRPALLKPGRWGAGWGRGLLNALEALWGFTYDLWAAVLWVLARWWRVALFVLAALAAAAVEWLWRGSLWGAASAAAANFGTPRGVLLVAGALLNGYAVAFMRLNRPSSAGTIRPGTFWDRRRDQNTFLWYCLLPLCLSATMLTTFWAWHRTTPRPYEALEFLYFLLFGAGVGLAGLIFYSHFIRRTWWDDPAERRLREVRDKIERLEEEKQGRDEKEEPDEAADDVLRVRRAEEARLTKEVDDRKAAVRRSLRRERWLMIVSNLLGGLLLWVVATRVSDHFDQPVVNPFGRGEFTGGAWGELLPYTEWWGAEIYATLSFPVYLLVVFLGLTLYVGLTSRRSERPPEERDKQHAPRRGGQDKYDYEKESRLSFGRYFIEDEDREWLARASAWLFIVMAAWLFFSGLVIFGPLLFFTFEEWLVAAGSVSGLVTVLGGGSAGTPGAKGKAAQTGWRGLLSTIGVNLVVLASFIFFACLVLLVALLTGTVVAWLAKYVPQLLLGYGAPGVTLKSFWAYPAFLETPARWLEYLTLPPARALQEYGEHFEIPARHLDAFRGHYPLSGAQESFAVTHFPTWLYLSAVGLALHLFGRAFSMVINLNKFSLHAGYRDRIIRAFLGASRPRGERQANPFTGFDPRDNLYMDELRPWVLRESDFEEPNGLRSFVEALANPDAEAPADAAAKAPRRARLRAGAARHLHEELKLIKDGSYDKYLSQASAESIDTNPSFRSALFADLGRIIQEKRLDQAGGFRHYLPAARKEYLKLVPPRDRRPPHGAGPSVLLNRLLLAEAFKDCLRYPPRLYRLLPVVNMALNLVGGDKLAWQHRRAESFTSTPLHSGSLFVGYRKTRDYGGKNGMYLGTAVAISGAAASSNMGYFSPSPFVTLALTFFNARLGWWLGNPGVHGARTFFRSHPQSALSPILDEAFGLTDDRNPYVLLSDGGHFENLGLYEMVLRRCRNIIVVDGSADPGGTLEGLGDAVRKIRIDLGIRIEFKPPFPILPRPKSEERQSGGYCAVGHIHYEDVDAEPPGPDRKPAGKEARPRCAHDHDDLTGRLVYIKPTIYGGEPRDIFNYAQSHPDFPHESTADQFFDEPQFESHRMLGYYILEELFEEALKSRIGESLCRNRDLQEFVDWLDERAESERGGARGAEAHAPAAFADSELPYE